MNCKLNSDVYVSYIYVRLLPQYLFELKYLFFIETSFQTLKGPEIYSLNEILSANHTTVDYRQYEAGPVY